MNFIFIIAALGLAVVAIYSIHTWAMAHALAALVGDKWVIQAEGWEALWPSLAAGLMAGAAVGLAIGWVAFGRLSQVLQEGKNEAIQEAEKSLFEQRQELAKRRASIDFEIQKLVKESTTASSQRAENFSLENEKNKNTILRLQRKIEIIEKRLAGSKRARAARKEKAQLTSL